MQNEHAPTVSAILDRYQRERLPSLAPRTQKDYTRHLRVLRHEFGDRIAAELQPKDFVGFLRVKKGPIQRNRQIAVLSAAFTQAVSYWFILPTNCLRDVKRNPSKPRDRLIADEEFEGAKAMASLRLRLAMQLSLITGQRQGDIISLKWTDIHGMEVHFHQAKTGKRLAIEITPDLEKVLDQCWKLKNGGCDGGEYVICTRKGQRYTSEGFRACFQRLMRKWKRLGNSAFTYHDIRAMCASKCATVQEAMYLLGHSNISMTARVYRRGIQRVKPLQLTAAA